MLLIPAEFKYSIIVSHFVLSYVNLYSSYSFNYLYYCNVKKNIERFFTLFDSFLVIFILY